MLYNTNNYGISVLKHTFGCDVKVMCYIVFVSHNFHWRFIKIELFGYVINAVLCDQGHLDLASVKKQRKIKHNKPPRTKQLHIFIKAPLQIINS